ncbi:hypothetical protein BU23DRAFT_560683 [Bimuria novae-zelandiae CBS 107.79]|uniref:Uncharacterized protein n=1 Tax=Bimuria novae-zelandiae CBS 107.79 TaxID=1447943 RepID=A0A6A5UNN2_9PLEO|nr:hypothetical protein BU23DRAFT_560683 [Bimuria novae-zelandiae CBS 107.79]
MMGLEEALRIKAKNDEELEEWCAAYKAGFIDDDGFVVSTGEELLPGEYTAVVKARERDAQREAAKKVASREASPKKDPLKKVQEGRVTKAAASKKASEFTIIDQTPAFLEPASAKAGPEKAEKAGKTNKAKAKGEPKPEAATAKPCSQTRKADDDFSVRSLPGLPHYQEYNYNQLVAICRERNIKSGGGAQKVRNRLIEDDILVTQDKFDERDVRNYSHEGRDHTTPAPFVQNAPVAKPAEMTPAMRKKQRSMKKNSPAPTTTEPSATVPATTKPEKSEKCAKTTKRARDDDNEDEVVAQPKSKKVKAT